MARCSKCNGCTSMWNMYRPEWCDDNECPEGGKEPEEVTRERAKVLEILTKEFNKGRREA